MQQTIINGVTIELVQGDITDLACDAIVNAANSSLVLGAGVAGAIARKGGPAIQRECDQIGHCDVGSAAITGGGNLRAKHVIHAVGPRMGEGNERQKLAGAVRTSLELAEKNNLQSIAFPAISTGIFGYPLDDAAKVILSTIIAFAQTSSSSLKTIMMCLWDKHAFETFSTELDKQVNNAH